MHPTGLSCRLLFVKRACNRTDYEASLIRVVDMGENNIIFRNYVRYERRLIASKSWISVFSSLIIVFTIKLRVEFWCCLVKLEAQFFPICDVSHLATSRLNIYPPRRVLNFDVK